eukprot:GHVU01169328.1.p1 GENE.GHVU01169328.1~~GHVU01169328.1.p1  ORF type:complete len:106 (+),score=2.52 GHVU01169328.1:207-524(+)
MHVHSLMQTNKILIPSHITPGLSHSPSVLQIMSGLLAADINRPAITSHVYVHRVWNPQALLWQLLSVLSPTQLTEEPVTLGGILQVTAETYIVIIINISITIAMD